VLAATYTEEQIRRAWVLRLNDDTDINELIYALRKLRKDNHMHKWADDDTITVKEIREAFKRQTSAAGFNVPMFLRDISEHREPEYPLGTVVRDAKGKFWMRAEGNFWVSFGSITATMHRDLARPLTVVS
jgi:hypothetical protein